MTDVPDIIDQFAPDMTFALFMERCQPKLVRYAADVLIPVLAGEIIRMRRVRLVPVMFPDKPHRVFVGQDLVTGDWYYR